jgi:nitroreductase/Pyruvate/2-oxoacid:ferredoxin oxidoreductase delta subunit
MRGIPWIKGIDLLRQTFNSSNMNHEHAIQIDQEKCIQCRLCAIECPAKTALGNQIRADQNSALCDRCFHCYAICPQHAIQVEGVEEELIPDGHHIEYQDLLLLLKKRRSHRKFARVPVPNEYLKRLTDSTKYSPTGGNFQDLSITIINNPDTRKDLEQAVIAYYDKIVRLLRNPAIRFFMRFSGDAKVKETAKDKEFFVRIEKIYADMKAGETNIFWDAPVVMLFHTSRLLPTALEDCILAASNVVLTAMTLKLGSCYVSLSQQAISASKKIKQLVGIPPTDRIHAVLVMGYPATRYRRIAPRKEKQVLFR